MHRQWAPKDAPPQCPACGKKMTFARDLNDETRRLVNVFECKRCNVTYSVSDHTEGPASAG
jgi:hypothetical protein